ncbi:unnamed protein product [Rhizophagus irregularis]|nr:unnamed protein product [Rhizophagus irregularis]CAB5331069.1 unnamed protein product [Rhizophagus irregularis]
MNFDFRMNILEFRPWNQNQLGLLGRISSDCWIGTESVWTHGIVVNMRRDKLILRMFFYFIGLLRVNSSINLDLIPAESNSDFKILDPLGAHGFYFY